VRAARAAGLPVGLVRPVSLAPFPNQVLAELAAQVEGFLVVEMNAGQMLDDVTRAVAGRAPIAFYGRLGGMVPFPDEILAELARLSGGAPAEPDPRAGWLARLMKLYPQLEVR
jgi:2-oxoglutarate ferredoxin oxidoreductase subunit alpha